MSNRKPRIYASCKAGCNWETIHRSEYEDGYPYAPVLLGYDGTFNVEIGKKYKVFKKDEYTDTYGFTFDIYFNGTAHTITITPEFDNLRNYVYFTLLDVRTNENYQTIVVYEINDKAETKVVDNGFYSIRKFSCLFNETDGSVYGNGESLFNYSYKEESNYSFLKQLSVYTTLKGGGKFYDIYNNKWVTTEEYYDGVKTGDYEFIERLETLYDEKTHKHHIINITWKDSYTNANGSNYSLVSNEIEIIENDDPLKYMETAEAHYVVDAICVVDTHSWKEYTGYVFVREEVNGNDYIAYYRADKEISTYSVKCVGCNNAYILNDEKTTMVKEEGISIFTPVRD